MAEIFVDMDLATGNDDGTTWEHAYQSLLSALDGSAVSGDNVWAKGTETDASAARILVGGTTIGHPIRVFGVKAATTNEPPVQSDLIPGWRTGESRTEANLAYNDGALPSYALTSVSNDLDITGQFYFYAIQIASGDNLEAGGGDQSHLVFEECRLTADQYRPAASANNQTWILVNSHLDHFLNQVMFLGADNSYFAMRGGKYTQAANGGVLSLGLIANELQTIKFIGVDFSGGAHTFFITAAGEGNPQLSFQNCQLHASTVLFSGVRSLSNYEMWLYQCTNVTGKSSGTIQNYDYGSDAGDITQETTAVRTNGANDGGGLWSFAFTPQVDGTRDQYYGLVGPEMYFEVTAGTSKTITVYIANSGAADYNNDDVWLEVIYPSEIGTAQYSNETVQMDLLGTPAAVTDDTDSTWGTGGNNPQKLVATVNPDYAGLAYCRVVFAKNFGSSPETLYVDPLPVYA